jgi:hypothetical protein
MAYGLAVMPSGLKTPSASPRLSFGAESRGLPCSLSTLRSPGHPGTTQDSLTDGCQPPDGIVHPQGSNKDFRMLLLSSCFLLPGFAWRNLRDV